MTIAAIILSILCGLTTIIISAVIMACLTMGSAADRQNGVEE